MKQLIFNKDSEYFRICSECKKEFMAHDKRQKFCCNSCHDDYHNRKKELKRLKKPPVSPAVPPDRAASPEFVMGLRKNKEILGKYPIGWKNYWVPITEIEDLGFDLYSYTACYESPNNPDCIIFEFGPYIMIRELEDHFIVKLKKQ